MPIDRIYAAIAVADVEAALQWYGSLFGRAPDARPMDGLAEWHFPPSAMIQLVADVDRAGRSLLTLEVDDLEQQLTVLRERGLAPDAMDDTTSEFVFFSSLTDPEGNAVNLVEQR